MTAARAPYERAPYALPEESVATLHELLASSPVVRMEADPDAMNRIDTVCAIPGVGDFIDTVRVREVCESLPECERGLAAHQLIWGLVVAADTSSSYDRNAVVLELLAQCVFGQRAADMQSFWMHSIDAPELTEPTALQARFHLSGDQALALSRAFAAQKAVRG